MGRSVATSSEPNGVSLEHPPFVLRWDRNQPLPVRPVRGARRHNGSVNGLQPPPWLATGPENAPFDFAGHVRRLCADIASQCAELAHIDVSRLLLGVTQARNGHTHGLQARVTPLR